VDPRTGSALVALVFYVVAYFITLFFNTALVGAAMIRMDGGNPSLGDGLRIAWERKGRIFGYACIAATVGLLLRSLEEKVGWLGRLVVKLIGVGWALATFLVVPVLVTATRAGGGGEGERGPPQAQLGREPDRQRRARPRLRRGVRRAWGSWRSRRSCSPCSRDGRC